MSERVIDPGAEFASPKGTVEWVIAFVERHPFCTLPGGEAKMLVDRIRELEKTISDIRHPDIYAKPG